MSGAASEPGLIRKEQYSPAEIDHLFTLLVLRLILAMAYPYIYGASQPDLNI